MGGVPPPQGEGSMHFLNLKASVRPVTSVGKRWLGFGFFDPIFFLPWQSAIPRSSGPGSDAEDDLGPVFIPAPGFHRTPSLKTGRLRIAKARRK